MLSFFASPPFCLNHPPARSFPISDWECQCLRISDSQNMAGEHRERSQLNFESQLCGDGSRNRVSQTSAFPIWRLGTSALSRTRTAYPKAGSLEAQSSSEIPLSMFPKKASAKSGNLSGSESGAEAPHSKTLSRRSTLIRKTHPFRMGAFSLTRFLGQATDTKTPSVGNKGARTSSEEKLREPARPSSTWRRPRSSSRSSGRVR